MVCLSHHGSLVPFCAAIKSALEVAGIEFISENGGGLGMRLTKRP